jgi:hypothetical protein
MGKGTSISQLFYSTYFYGKNTMKKLAIGLFAVLAVVAVSAAIVPLQQASAQNTVTATQSNSFTGTISQSISQSASAGAFGSASNSASQGFCLQVNQQNSAAGNTASNTGTNTISFADCS